MPQKGLLFASKSTAICIKKQSYLHLKAQLDASFCKKMNRKGIASGVQMDVECHEKGGKGGKNTGRKTHNRVNLAKLNDAKSGVYVRVFYRKAIAKVRKSMRFASLKPLKNARRVRNDNMVL